MPATRGQTGRATRGNWGTRLLLVFLAAAAGGAMAVVFVWRPTPAPLAAPDTSGGTVAVAKTMFDDARDVDLRVDTGLSAQVLTTRAGVVTSSTCKPGVTLTSGQPVATIDDRPIVAVATATPMWREIRAGIAGPDVSSLRRELGRLGKLPPGAAAGDAPADIPLLDAAAKLAGLPAGGPLPRAAFAWLPSQSVTVEKCEVPVGAVVESGVALASLAPAVTAIRLASAPADAVPGARMLRVGDGEVPVKGDSVVDPASIAKLVATPAYSVHAQSAGQAPFQGRWRLAAPMSATTLPASAVVANGQRACVSVGGKGVPVTIIGSSLGRAMVTFTGTPPDRVDAEPARSLTCA